VPIINAHDHRPKSIFSLVKDILTDLMHVRKRMMDGDVFEEATQKDVLSSGMFGFVWTEDIHVSTMDGSSHVMGAAPDHDETKVQGKDPPN